jgi:hypothetical protein
MLLGPLVGVLEDESCGEIAYNKRVEDLLAPAIAQFAVAVQQATGNDLLWKSLNNKWVFFLFFVLVFFFVCHKLVCGFLFFGRVLCVFCVCLWLYICVHVYVADW